MSTLYHNLTFVVLQDIALFEEHKPLLDSDGYPAKIGGKL